MACFIADTVFPVLINYVGFYNFKTLFGIL
jgi:hypothetical protein